MQEEEEESYAHQEDCVPQEACSVEDSDQVDNKWLPQGQGEEGPLQSLQQLGEDVGQEEGEDNKEEGGDVVDGEEEVEGEERGRTFPRRISTKTWIHTCKAPEIIWMMIWTSIKLNATNRLSNRYYPRVTTVQLLYT